MSTEGKRLYIVTVETEFEYAALASSEKEAESFAGEASHDAQPDHRVYSRRATFRKAKAGTGTQAEAPVCHPPEGWEGGELVYCDRTDGDVTWDEAVEIERRAQDAEAAAQYAREHQLPLPAAGDAP